MQRLIQGGWSGPVARRRGGGAGGQTGAGRPRCSSVPGVQVSWSRGAHGEDMWLVETSSWVGWRRESVENNKQAGAEGGFAGRCARAMEEAWRGPRWIPRSQVPWEERWSGARIFLPRRESRTCGCEPSDNIARRCRFLDGRARGHERSQIAYEGRDAITCEAHGAEGPPRGGRRQGHVVPCGRLEGVLMSSP